MKSLQTYLFDNITLGDVILTATPTIIFHHNHFISKRNEYGNQCQGVGPILP